MSCLLALLWWLLRPRAFAVVSPYTLIWNSNMVSSSIWCLAPNKVVEQELPLVFPLFPSSFNESMRFPFLLLYLVYSYVTCMYTWVCYIYKVPGCSGSRRSHFSNRGIRPSSSALVIRHHPITLVAVQPAPFKRTHLARDATMMPLLCDLLASLSCLLPSSQRRSSSILYFVPP